jgi:hypothetical protein
VTGDLQILAGYVGIFSDCYPAGILSTQGGANTDDVSGQNPGWQIGAR